MREFIVQDIQALRLDRFVRRECEYLTQGVIEKSLRLGQIKVNNKRVKSSTRLRKGDVVLLSDKLSFNSHASRKESKISYFSPAVISLANKLLTEYLIFSCAEFFAINKPYGLATQGGSKINISVDHALLYLNKTTKSDYRLVHRLDKETSGVLIVAKNLNSCILLGQSFKTKELHKTYLAIVEGTPFPLTGSIENYIDKDKSGVYEIVQETSNGKLASTIYETLISQNGFSIIKYTPLTGRMHQLRFHSKYLGCPILGDKKYGGKMFDRMMLHSYELFIPAKILGKEYMINAPLDKFFKFMDF